MLLLNGLHFGKSTFAPQMEVDFETDLRRTRARTGRGPAAIFPPAGFGSVGFSVKSKKK